MTDRIKVLQIITALKKGGGAERLLLDLVATMDRSRFDVKIISLRNELAALDAYGHSEMEVEVFDLECSRIKNAMRLRKFVRKFQPDVIHAHMFHSLVVSVFINAWSQSPFPLCFTSHTTGHAPWRRQIIGMLRKRRTMDITFTAEQHPDINSLRTTIIPNGVRVDTTNTPRKPWKIGKKVCIISVGRLIELKDCLELVRSFAAANIPEATLEFVGAGPMENDIRSLTVELGLAGRVRLLGFKTNIRELLKAADIFVMHSQWEGMPMAILEAGAEAMPVISTPVGAIPSILGSDRGILVEPDNFSSALQRLTGNPSAALEMGRKLKSHVNNNYSIIATTRAHEQLYEKLV
jgi:glycosyltransferase involved in cell wall biosynthesis